MLPCLPLLLLMGLSAGTVTADEGLALGAEAGSWITLTLEDGGIHLQLQEVKRGKASQFFGLMGKRVRGKPPQGWRRQTRLLKPLSCTELFPGREDKDHGSE
uniref:Tachykinin 4 n=1 Tax=Ursus americanus TaxID=9643 RepID=A0A452RXG7_URSAM